MSSNVLSCLKGKYISPSCGCFESYGLLGRAKEVKQSGGLGFVDVPFIRESVGTVSHPL